MNGPGPHSPVPALMSKLHASEMVVEVTRKALELHGGTGYSRELPLERYHRDALSCPLHGPATDIGKSMLAGFLMGLPPH